MTEKSPEDFHIVCDAKFFKDMFGLMSTLVTEEVQFQIQDDGIFQKQFDAPKIGMTKMFIPKHYFKVMESGSIKALRLGIADINAILKKLSLGDVLDVTVDTKLALLHIEIQGKRIRRFNLPTFEPEPVDRREPRVVPQVRIKTTMEGLLYCMEDVEGFLVKNKKRASSATGQIEMKTTPEGLRITSEAENGLFSTDGLLNTAWDIMQYKGTLGQSVKIALAYGIDITKSVSNITNVAQLEFSTDFPLRIIAELPLKGASLEFWIAPRISTEEEAVQPATEVKR